MSKRIFDFALALLLLAVLIVPLILCGIAAAVDTKSSGLFVQQRIGRYAQPFLIYKLRTYCAKNHRINRVGHFLRRYKLDEMPQLINILCGQMSFVGPRPDVPGYYDQLKGDDRALLSLRPGLTSEASLKYYNEEYLLQQQQHPQEYNDGVIFPDKVKINLQYLHRQSLWGDIQIIIKTVFRIY